MSMRRRKHVSLLLLIVTLVVYAISRLLQDFIRDAVRENQEPTNFNLLNSAAAAVPKIEDDYLSSFFERKNQVPGSSIQTSSHLDHADVLSSILRQMEGDWHWEWIQQRVLSNVEEFKTGANSLKLKDGESSYDKKKILVVPGVLTLTNFAQREAIKRGGPLGELLQWADLISGLHVLGHSLTLMSDLKSAAHILLNSLNGDTEDDRYLTEGCQSCGYSIIFTDIGGYRSLSAQVTTPIKERIRILDVFGTEAMYNDKQFGKSHNIAPNHWRMLGLNLKHFLTLYPHSPDNHFLGLAVSSKVLASNITKENIGIIFGKEAKYLKGQEAVLQLIGTFVELHATMPNAGHVLSGNVRNHGLLQPYKYDALAKKAKVFIGLGHPIESPGVLHCLASGCVFLNPKKPPREQFLHGKPTSRRITSQNTYLERYIGPPHVYTIDYSDLAQVKETMALIMKNKVEPLLPYEFSIEGYVQRLHSYITHQDPCSDLNTIWPPVEELIGILSDKGASCVDACYNKGLVCEPAFFTLVNKPDFFDKMNISCDSSAHLGEVYAPATDPQERQCIFQQRRQLYSCAGSISEAERICPCRDFMKHQIALCAKCS